MQTATELEQENIYLKAQLADSTQQLEHKDQQLTQQQSYIHQLEEALRQQRNKHFGVSSEKVGPDQLGLFNEAESALEAIYAQDKPAVVEVGAHARQSKPRVSIPGNLPREEIIYDLADADKRCPHDGSELKLIGSEDHEQLDIIPAQVKVIRHKRLKYACPCCDQHIVTASKPNQAIDKSIASAGLLAFVATQKYCDALPLYRQSEMFKRIGIELDRRNLANWMIKSGELVQPLINLLRDQLLQQPIIHMDETPVQVLNESGKRAHSKSYMWVQAAGPPDQAIILFDYDPSRSQQVPTQLLTDYHGALMVDGYSGYNSVCEQDTLIRLGCWAHARRTFIEAQRAVGKKGKSAKADYAVKLIGKLYALEKSLKEAEPTVRYAQRQDQAKPVVDKLQAWLQTTLPAVPPKTALGKALHYLHAQWPRLTAYLDDGDYPIDNNRAENAIRPFAIGRKNWLFCNSVAGAKASANLYSLTETAKANGLNPYDYLKQIFTDLPNANTVEDIEQLLPWRLAKNDQSS